MKPLVRRTYWSTKFVADSSQREDWLNTSHWEGREDRARWEEESPSSRGPWEALEEHEESASRRLSQAHEVPDRHLLRRLRPEGRRSDEAPAQRLLARGHDDVGRLRTSRLPKRTTSRWPGRSKPGSRKRTWTATRSNREKNLPAERSVRGGEMPFLSRCKGALRRLSFFLICRAS